MKKENYDRATPFIREMQPLEDMRNILNAHTPQLTITWGERKLNIDSMFSPDKFKMVTDALKKELDARIKVIEKKLEEI